MLRQPHCAFLVDEELRKALDQALRNENEARYVIDEKCIAKIEARNLSTQDLSHILRHWEKVGEPKWDGAAWRYKIEGYNIDGKWMAAVVAVYVNPIIVVAVTGFFFSRGRPKP